MSSKHVIPTLAATVACALGVVPVASASSDPETASSANWAGYVVGGSSSSTQFKSVSGSWVVPTVKCTSGQSYSSFWVGLGGANGGSSSASSSSSWSDPSSGMRFEFELGLEHQPRAGGHRGRLRRQRLAKLLGVVRAGAVGAGHGQHGGPPRRPHHHQGDRGRRQRDHATEQHDHRRLVREDPPGLQRRCVQRRVDRRGSVSCSQGVSDCTPLPLADFGTAQFSGASATTTDGHTGTISDSDWQSAAVQLSPGASTRASVPSSPPMARPTRPGRRRRRCRVTGPRSQWLTPPTRAPARRQPPRAPRVLRARVGTATPPAVRAAMATRPAVTAAGGDGGVRRRWRRRRRGLRR